ncbi:MAG TPA: hypothetical protein VFO62_06380 [Candidatus Binatia bacterium]|nr:hypothetical protein [Candidatus Binatia bacterium]
MSCQPILKASFVVASAFFLLSAPVLGTVKSSVAGENLKAFPSKICFGRVSVGDESSARRIRLRNVSAETAIVYAVSLSPQFALGALDCFDGGLAPGQSCSVQVRGAPTARGTHVGTLRVQYCFPSDPVCPGAVFGEERFVDIPLRGRGK